jgi:hypothetical protein
MKNLFSDRFTLTILLWAFLFAATARAAPVPGIEELSEENLLKKPVLEIPESIDAYGESLEGAAVKPDRPEPLGYIHSPLARKVSRVRLPKNSSPE